MVRNFQWTHLNFNFSRYSKSYFSKTAAFISSIGVGIENCLVVERFRMGKLSICVHCISILTVRNLREVLLLFRSIFGFVFLSHYKFEFVHHELSLKTNTCSGVLRRRTVDFVHCIRILIVQFFYRKPLSKLSRHSNLSSFVIHKYWLH